MSELADWIDEFYSCGSFTEIMAFASGIGFDDAIVSDLKEEYNVDTVLKLNDDEVKNYPRKMWHINEFGELPYDGRIFTGGDESTSPSFYGMPLQGEVKFIDSNGNPISLDLAIHVAIESLSHY